MTFFYVAHMLRHVIDLMITRRCLAFFARCCHADGELRRTRHMIFSLMRALPSFRYMLLIMPFATRYALLISYDARMLVLPFMALPLVAFRLRRFSLFSRRQIFACLRLFADIIHADDAMPLSFTRYLLLSPLS